MKSRGSEKLLAAWKNRVLTDEAVKEIAAELEKSPAVVEEVAVVGASNPTGVHVSLMYTGDDVPWCGNDLAFWLKWHRIHGGRTRPPKIIINGIPFPDVVRIQLEFGDPGNPVRELENVNDIAIRGR
ncbi:MAG TPA: hypothetical protein VIV40_08340 [Kofleriaceae bacterium]